ncbi:beta strand repeat-containing protein, partial [Woodsholea maritima]|uniref:beta strand repeat-containing protein n=1 Tax=Woodsholea maritima TaxID=240237 RepID=UPI000592A279
NGAFSFDVSIASDDPDENPFNFVVSGTGTGGAPDIAVSSSQGGALTDGVANTLGNKAVTTQDTLTYTITNVGTADLTGLALTVDNEVNVALGTVTLLTGTSITPGGTAVTFQVPYTPTHNGAFSFDVSIASNDGDENPFNFAVSGTGTGGAPEIAISSSESGAVNDGATDTFVSTPAAGSASTVTYTITNSGTDTLTLTTPTVGTNISGASNITVNSLVLGSTSVAPGGETTTLVVNYTPTLGGSFGFALSLANDDGNENPYDITASGTASASPDIAVSSSQGGALTDGVANTLGNKTVATQDALTYTITNPGLANLTGLALTVNNASNVSIDNTPALSGTSIAPSGTAVTFQVQYTPTNNGAFSFDVSIASDDPDENPFNFAVSGTGTGGAPDIAVSSSQGGALTDGVANALGNKAVTTQDTLTYTITNVGTADLTGLALTVDNASNVTLGTVTALTGTSITPGGTAVTFQVPYTPTHNGAFSFDVSIA